MLKIDKKLQGEIKPKNTNLEIPSNFKILTNYIDKNPQTNLDYTILNEENKLNIQKQTKFTNCLHSLN